MTTGPEFRAGSPELSVHTKGVQGSWCDIRLLTQTIANDQCWPLDLVTMPGIGLWQSYSTVVEALLGR